MTKNKTLLMLKPFCEFIVTSFLLLPIEFGERRDHQANKSVIGLKDRNHGSFPLSIFNQLNYVLN